MKQLFKELRDVKSSSFLPPNILPDSAADLILQEAKSASQPKLPRSVPNPMEPTHSYRIPSENIH